MNTTQETLPSSKVVYDTDEGSRLRYYTQDNNIYYGIK
jgi:hypothetical protein